jgi:hypothetical protein
LEDGRGSGTPTYIYAGLIEPHNSGGDADDIEPATEEGTAGLHIFASNEDEVEGAILLAEVTTANGAVATVTDRRKFVPLSQLLALFTRVATLESTVATMQAQIAALQAAIGAASGGSGLTLDTISVSVTDSTKGKAYIDAIKTALEATIANGGRAVRSDPKLKRILEELASLDLGLSEIHPGHARRSRATRAVIGVYGDGSGGSPNDLNVGNATVYPDEQTIGPGGG